MVHRTPEDGKRQELNDEAPWDSFDPLAYVDHNYRRLRDDDAQIIRVVRDYFTDHFSRRNPAGPISGIDVGSGANLYPAFTLLPWCEDITLYERSEANVVWLESQVPSYGANWDEFWDLLSRSEPYARVADPRAALRKVTRVKQGNLFDLPHAGWGIGTMFFVAESMTTSFKEFQGAVERFTGALVPGAPYAAAFMQGSVGYAVGEEFFPACSVDVDQVRETLAPFTDGEVRITPIGMPPGGGLRPGYEGMIVACGRRNSE
ncbi:SCO2525 family SAM-dependent methyltransferase [Streptomyces sp. GC420]|uniref:SCO2525 family SAM-dependent methyltransferase n=1 Tax=Streptomyces sp. GC420 TaxID=2697568 RepID=UPI001414FAE2|nr:SCO2525 family SAM-dependent methyltransferase [Streptomyces sp. GC420]NBM18404.1 methyltransferase [Streptomyces sp. GC420]